MSDENDKECVFSLPGCDDPDISSTNLNCCVCCAPYLGKDMLAMVTPWGIKTVFTGVVIG